MDDAHLLDDDAPIRPRSRWPLLVFLAALLGGGGWLGWSLFTAVEPLQVLVAVELDGHWFDGSKPAARLADGLNERLGQLGFSVVPAGDPQVVRVLEAADGDLLKAARKLKAAFVIGGRFEREVLEHPVGDGYFEVRLRGALTVQRLGDASPQTAEVQAWAGDRSVEAAVLRLAGKTLQERVAAAALPLLVLHPELQRLADGSADAAGRLAKARKFVGARGQQLRTFEAAYEALVARRLAAEEGPVKPRYHRPARAADGLLAVTERGALIKTADIRPFVTVKDHKLRFLEDHETLAWLPAEGEAAAPFWTGYNIYGYPGLSADGRTLALVEDLLGWAKTITVVPIEGGPARRLRVDPEARFSALKPSPDGGRLALYERPCRRCPSDLVILDAQSGALLRRLPHEGGRFGGFAWIDPLRLVVIHDPSGPGAPAGEEGDGGDEDAADEAAAAGERVFAAEGPTVWEATVERPALRAIHPLAVGEHLEWPAPTPDGQRVAFTLRDAEGFGLLVLSLADGAVVRHRTPRATDHVQVHPQGGHLTFSLGGGLRSEIAVMPIDGGPVVTLTRNRVRDRYPRFSPDGARIWYETLDDDPNFPSARKVVFLASVPFQP